MRYPISIFLVVANLEVIMECPRILLELRAVELVVERYRCMLLGGHASEAKRYLSSYPRNFQGRVLDRLALDRLETINGQIRID